MHKELKPFDENTKIPLSFGDEVNTLEESFQSVMNDAEKIVDAVKVTTNTMRKENFDVNECALSIYYFYSGEAWDISVKEDENLYELPYELNSLFVYIDRHQDEYDLTKQKETLMTMTTELWQLLPDFYRRGHEHPFVKPDSYDPEKPYPSYIKPGQMKYRFWGKTLVNLRKKASKDAAEYIRNEEGPIKKSVPFDELMNDFEVFVKKVKFATQAMKASKFDQWTCEKVLKTFYTEVPYANRTDDLYDLSSHDFGWLKDMILQFRNDYDMQKYEAEYNSLEKELQTHLPDFYQGLKFLKEQSSEKPSNTNPKEDEKTEQVHSEEKLSRFEIGFAFTRYIGWIDLFITADDSTVRMRTSSVFPPYQDFVSFLENIAENKLPAECRIDEEGITRILKATSTKNITTVNLTIGTYKGTTIDATFDRRLLIAEFILSWEEFMMNSYAKFKEWWIGQEVPTTVDLSKLSLDRLDQYLMDNKGTFSIDTSGIHFMRNFTSEHIERLKNKKKKSPSSS